MNDTSEIIGLLRSGPFWGAQFKKILAVYLSLVAFCLLFMGIEIWLFSVSQMEDPQPIAQFVTLIVFLALIASLMPFLLLILIVKNEKKRKQVRLWLEDAVEVQAQSKEIGRICRLGAFPCVKLQIDFDIDGVHYRRFSESVSQKGEAGGYYYIWRKYGDRRINILYSPKYDEVMVLKQK